MDTSEIIQKKLREGPKNLTSLLKNRFSPRVFSAEPISADDVSAIVEAARFAPSSNNRQPWQFFLAPRTSPAFKEILTLLYTSNAQWAKEAGLLVVACARLKDENGDVHTAMYDLGLAVMSMVVEAQSRNIYTRQMGGFDKEKAAVFLKLPEDIRPVVCIAFGSLGDYQNADTQVLQKEIVPRTRRSDIAVYL